MGSILTTVLPSAVDNLCSGKSMKTTASLKKYTLLLLTGSLYPLKSHGEK